MLQKRLPTAEFEIMNTIWSMTEPVTSVQVAEHLTGKPLKQQTIVTVLSRLEKKGFLRSVKPGKERNYYVVIDRESYMQFEAQQFRAKFSQKSAFALMRAFYGDETLPQEQIDELRAWLDERSPSK